MDKPDLTSLPDMVLSDNEPVFNEPWEAQAFAMVIQLHQARAFTWSEWAETLSAEIHGSVSRDYYQHWLAALEKIVDKKQLVTAESLQIRKQAWHDAAASTAHGDPIVLA